MEAKELLDILRQAEQLKCRTRHSETSSGRRESVAEHSWRLALMALLEADEFPKLDMDRVVRMCLIHDLGEAFTGDIPAFEKTDAHRRAEREALDWWVSGFSSPLREEWQALFQELEGQKTPEARLCRALDRLEAVVQHNESDIGSWLPLEYDLQLTYGAAQAAEFPPLRALKEEIDRQTRQKIERERPAPALPALETHRLTLRPFSMGDLPALQEILGDEETMAQLEPPYARERTAAFLHAFCVRGQKALAAVRREDRRLIGYLLYKPCGDQAVFELGWIFRRDCWRKGYGFEAERALIDWAFSSGGAEKLFAETIDPVRSVGLMEKLGMTREGVQRRQVRDSAGRRRDLYLYGLTREQWKTQGGRGHEKL